MVDPNSMTLGEHLEDLRRRLILAILGLVPILVLGLAVAIQTLELLMVPVRRSLSAQGLPPEMLATGPLEPFFAYVKIAVVITAIVGSPWILYQLWRFISPGLYSSERRFVYVLIPMSALLSALGVLFLYFVILPVVLTFFIKFGASIGERTTPVVEVAPEMVFPTIPTLAGDPAEPSEGQAWINTDLMQFRVAIPEGDGVIVRGTALTKGFGISQQYRVIEYVKLILNLAIAFVIGFQTPVVVLLLGWAGLVDRAMLIKYRRHAVLVAAVVSALLTPADPLSMLLLAGPLFILYELGGVLLVLLPASRVAGDDPFGEDDR